jgi:hypothetical protein
MGEPERVPGNSEPALSQDELTRLRNLLRGMPTYQPESPTPHKSFHEVGVELHSISARLELMQKVFGGSALIVIACIGFLFVRSIDISVSVGKIETAMDERFDGVDQRFDGVDQRFDGIDQRFDGIDQRFDGIDQRFDGIDKRLDAMDARFDRIDKRLDAITALLTPPKVQQQ